MEGLSQRPSKEKVLGFSSTPIHKCYIHNEAGKA